VTFRVGQKVVCVDSAGVENVNEGHVYVVERVFIGRSFQAEGKPTLWLVGVVDWEKPSKGGFLARRFRPVVERQTDISIFTKMLTQIGADA
jgi:hypothetical protein